MSPRARMSDHYVEENGVRRRRGSSEDFDSLPGRHQIVVEKVPGFEGDAELITWMKRARAYYDYGLYQQALSYLTRALERLPAFEPYLFYYVRVCKRVLAAPLTTNEARFEKRVNRYLSLPKWVKYLLPRMKREVRCKWCGRYGPYIDPDTPTFGFDRSANSCGGWAASLPRIGSAFCGRMYHMPSWLWDSPDGRAYSYYRMSFADKAFYEEFERDYDPDPRCQHRLTAPTVWSSPPPSGTTNAAPGILDLFREKERWRDLPPDGLMAMAAGLSTFGQAVRFIALMETTGILQHNIVPLLRHKDTRFGLAGISARLTSEGNALGDGGQYDRAKEFFELALALNPRNAPAMLSMTIVEVHRGDCRAAASWAEKLQRLRPSEAPEDVVEEALRDLEVKGSLAELRTEAAGWVARCQ